MSPLNNLISSLQIILDRIATMHNVSYPGAFLGGIALSLTPCVYPLIPITVSYIGIKGGTSKLKALFLSFVYVTGMAITYSALGFIASLTGKLFGTISSNPITQIFAGIVIILFGISMLDIFYINLPQLIKLPKIKEGDYFSAFLLGASSGLIITPCITPVLNSILLYLATKRSLFYGATLLLTFAYGMGLIFILAGTFSATLINLPKAGKWMLYIKNVFAFLLIVMGVFFVYKGIRGL